MSDYVVVTAISSFRMRYVMHKDDLRALNKDVEPTDKELTEWAMDVVTCRECEEFSQMHLGEQIADVQAASEEEILDLFNHDNDYLKSWSDNYKLEWIRNQLRKKDG